MACSIVLWLRSAQSAQCRGHQFATVAQATTDTEPVSSWSSQGVVIVRQGRRWSAQHIAASCGGVGDLASVTRGYPRSCGVTCIKLAGALFEKTWSRNILCHLFVVDPVAGTYKGTQNANRTLNANVKYFVSTLAMHEGRGFFHVQDADRIRQTTPFTRCAMLPMPGVHNTAPIGKSDVADVTANLACTFLQQFGTSMNKVRRPHMGFRGEMVAAYTRIASDAQGYAVPPTLGTKIQGGVAPREFLEKMQNYVKSNYWVNDHHRRCFKEDYTAVYQFMFHGAGGGARPLREIDAGFNQLLIGGTSTGNAIKLSLQSKYLIADTPQGI